MPPDKLAKAIALSRIRNILDIVGSIWGIVVLWLLLAARGAGRAGRMGAEDLGPRWIQGVVFFAAFLIITDAGRPAAGLDRPALRAQLRDQRAGVGQLVWRRGKGAGTDAAVRRAGAAALQLDCAPLAAALLARASGWSRCRSWCFSFFCRAVAGAHLRQVRAARKSNPALVAKLEKVVARTGTNIPPDRMYLMKASVKTNGLNAYVSGIGATKRIVVWDTTAGPHSRRRGAVHLRPRERALRAAPHSERILPATAVGTVLCLLGVRGICGVAGAAIWRAMGRRAETGSSRTGFVVLLFAISIAGFLLEPVSNAVSRHFEHQADVYGQEAIHGIVPDPQKTAVAAFNALGQAWLDDPNPSPFIEFWLYSHPSTEHRANFALHYDPWANGGHGEFFKN